MGVSGSAFSNLLYCPPGAKFLEFRPQAMGVPFWLALAKQVGLEHHAMVVATEGRRKHVSVDVEAAAQAIGHMLD